MNSFEQYVPVILMVFSNVVGSDTTELSTLEQPVLSVMSKITGNLLACFYFVFILYSLCLFIYHSFVILHNWLYTVNVRIIIL